MSKKTLRSIIWGGIFLGILIFAYWLDEIFTPLLISFLIAYILNPVVNFFERKKINRVITITGIYLIFGFLIVFMLIFLIPLVAGEASSFYKSIPPYLEKLKGWAEELIARWNEKYPDRKIDWESILDRVKVAIENNAQRFATTGLGITSWIIEKISSGIKEILIFLSYVILIPIYTFFLLHNLNRIRDWIFLRLPEKYKEKTILVLSRIDRAMSSFFRGKLIICIIKGILTAIGLSIVGIRFAFVFGIIQTVASIIPYLPLVLALIPAELVVIFDLGAQWNLMISVAIIFIIIELIEGVLLTPLILGKEMGLHPIYIILALLIGGTLFGLFGLLIAIPIASIIKILLQELLGKNLHEVKANP